ncbi:hypothetical protein AURDEDRAFT_123477 [Auricularia subglabra TFB-10046 SS5]|nr:hypothetical protein AURDEDRAFT_123477 [Auricularia subglabra TFB-10046 SS5]
MSDSDGETSSSPPPATSSATFSAPKDTALTQILKKYQDRRDRQQAARKEANSGRTDAFDKKKDKKAKNAKVKTASVPASARKSPGTIIFFPEGPAAFNNAPVPSKVHVAKLREEGLCAVGVRSDDLKISRDWTHDDSVDFFGKEIAAAVAASSAAIGAWMDNHPGHSEDEVPPIFRVLTREGKRLSVTPTLRPTGLDLQEAIPSASNWFERKLYLTAGLDASLFTEDETSVYRPCALQRELDGIANESEGVTDTASQIDAADVSADEYVAPPLSGKRKRAEDGPITRAAKRQMREASHISVSDDDEPSTSAAVAHSTFAATGFPSPPKRNRTHAAQAAP